MRPTDDSQELRVPFPVIGGKRKVASLIWSRLGDVRNYVEPFAFGASVLFGRPGGAGAIETINDLNAYVPNFWRAVQRDPDAVAAAADWPVIEADMHARHRWLVTSDAARYALQRVREDPDYFDARMAGWWAWGACCWIGTGWCDDASSEQMPTLEMCAGGGKGVNGVGTFGKRPQLCNGNTTAGPGVLRHVDAPRDTGRPDITCAFTRGKGVNANDGANACEDRRAWLTAWMRRLADRLRPVRVCCGHWARVCDSDSTLTRLGVTGACFDPPYAHSITRVLAWVEHLRGNGPAPAALRATNRTKRIYANDNSQDVDRLVAEVTLWCLKRGRDPEIRIALCGLDGEYPSLEAAGWTTEAWTSSGYQNRTDKGKANAARERIWFSPACIAAKADGQLSMFAA